MRSSASLDSARVRKRKSGAYSPVRALTAGALGLGVAVLLGLVFAGSPATLAEGVRIAGVDVGGLTPKDARRLLERRSRELADVPVPFTDGARTYPIRPRQLGVDVDWRAAVATAQREGEGFAPVRGFRRLKIRFFPAELSPPIRAYDAAVEYEVRLLARAVNRPPSDAALVRHGLRFDMVPARTGRTLDREAAARVVVAALAGFERSSPVGLPVRTKPAAVTASDLRPALVAARRAVSAPVHLELDQTRWLVRPRRIAQLLLLPRDGAMRLRIGGPAADAWFRTLARRVDRRPVDARFVVDGERASIVPSQPGLGLDVPASARAILAALGGPAPPRAATLVVRRTQARRTTADARAMGVARLVSTYTTIYGGDPNRVHNVRLVAHLVDGALIPPGTVFSFNGTTGERNADKGFLEAPVIINGEVLTGLGGGVCQVSTTVFNAAYEAGLPITERTNHALYISHYPLGRDATVNYPDVDLKFVNDSTHWLLLRTFVGSSSLTVSLYGTPVHRRVESLVSPLVVTGPIHVKRIKDASLEPGETNVEDEGAPPRRTQVERKVYSPSGRLLLDATFYSTYRAEPKVIRFGPKKKKANPPTKADAARPA